LALAILEDVPAPLRKDWIPAFEVFEKEILAWKKEPRCTAPGCNCRISLREDVLNIGLCYRHRREVFKKERRKECKKIGLCYQCETRPIAPGSVSCFACKEYRRQKQKESRHRRRQERHENTNTNA
jgi:hypothetical protein